MQLDAIKKLSEMGFNTPMFVIDPLEIYGVKTYIHMKQKFQTTDNFTVLGICDATGSNFEQRCLDLHGAVACLDHLHNLGFRAMIFPDIVVDYRGSVTLTSAISGVFRINGKSPIKYSFLQDLTSVVVRHIARTVGRICYELDHQNVWVEFIWADDFQGSLGTKLVLTNFHKL